MALEKMITPKTTIEEIVHSHPELIKILLENGLTCIACGEPLWGTLEENAVRQGLTNLEEVILKLNQSILP